MSIKNTHIQKQKRTRGFTLIETLVAVSVLLISLTGPLSIATQSLNSAYYARDQITAFYLAQEAVEYVRAVRDENYLRNRGWLTGLNNCIDTKCTINFPDFNHNPCGSTCGPVLINRNNELFGDNVGDPTIYTRSVLLETVPGYPDEVTIRVVVSWKTGGLNRQFTISEQLLNWLGY